MKILAKFPRSKLYSYFFIQDLKFRMTFFQRYAYRFSKFYEPDQYFHLGMEGSLYNRSFFDSFQHKQNEKGF